MDGFGYGYRVDARQTCKCELFAQAFRLLAFDKIMNLVLYDFIYYGWIRIVDHFRELCDRILADNIEFRIVAGKCGKSPQIKEISIDISKSNNLSCWSCRFDSIEMFSFRLCSPNLMRIVYGVWRQSNRNHNKKTHLIWFKGPIKRLSRMEPFFSPEMQHTQNIKNNLFFFSIAQFTCMSNEPFAARKHSRERSIVGRDWRREVNINSSDYMFFFY